MTYKYDLENLHSTNSKYWDKYYIKKNPKLEFLNACYRGNIDLVNLMIEKGANRWNYGLYGACRGGHIDIVNLMIKKRRKMAESGLEGRVKVDI